MPGCGMAADIHQCKSIVPSLDVKLSAIQEAPMNMWLYCLILTFTGWFKNFQRPMPLAFRYSGSLVTVSLSKLVMANITPAVQSYLRALAAKKKWGLSVSVAAARVSSELRDVLETEQYTYIRSFLAKPRLRWLSRSPRQGSLQAISVAPRPASQAPWTVLSGIDEVFYWQTSPRRPLWLFVTLATGVNTRT